MLCGHVQLSLHLACIVNRSCSICDQALKFACAPVVGAKPHTFVIACWGNHYRLNGTQSRSRGTDPGCSPALCCHHHCFGAVARLGRLSPQSPGLSWPVDWLALLPRIDVSASAGDNTVPRTFVPGLPPRYRLSAVYGSAACHLYVLLRSNARDVTTV